MRDDKRSLPGWSLARDSARKPAKQGWECPTPTVADWEDYKAWKAQQTKKDELPAAPQIFLADMSLLFYQDPEVHLPWVHRLKCELPHRVGRLSGELPVKASYVGFGTGDDPAPYKMFKEAMAQIGISLCRQIHYPPNRFEIAHLEQSDLILIGGGDRRRLWETLCSDLDYSTVGEHIKWRYLQGAVTIAVGEAMSLLGSKSWYTTRSKNELIPYKAMSIFPHIVASEAEDVDLEDAVESLGGAGVVIFGISPGGGLILNADGLIEPVRHMVQEYRYDWRSSSIKRAILIGPPRGTGLICPLYAAMQRGQNQDREEEADVWSYALTQDEEEEEERLAEQFNPRDLWLSPKSQVEVERLKHSGNDAFKAGKADLAVLKYEQARILINSSAQRWSDLDEDTQTNLLALVPGPKTQDKARLENKSDNASPTQLVETVEGALLWERQCGCVQDPHECTSALVEIRDNLVEAFLSANEAMSLSVCASAKAWYRRACVFEKMRDPRNAMRDLEQALLLAPDDKMVLRKHAEMKEAAAKVAEDMYYARHKEFDKQLVRMKTEIRRVLVFQGSYTDPFEDELGQFSIAQPVARLVEGTLEDIDGRLQLHLDTSSQMEKAPYLHPHALWTWEFLMQKTPGLQHLQIENADLGSGPLEWLCKGLRTHSELRKMCFIGTHLGPAGAKMVRNVLAQNSSVMEVVLDRCALLDAGLFEIAEGLRDNNGRLEALSLRQNYFTAKRLRNLADVLCENDNNLGLTELDLSQNPLTPSSAAEIGRIIGSDNQKLREIKLQECMIDLAGFWRLVGNLSDARVLSKLNLCQNPIGRGTRRCWCATMGPTIRCDVILSDKPLKEKKAAEEKLEQLKTRGYPLPGEWM